MSFEIHRGVNVTPWAGAGSGSAKGEIARTLEREDLRRIAGWGFDHVRIVFDECLMWDDAGRERQEFLDSLNEVLDWAEGEKLRAILDLHTLRTHFFLDQTEPKLFTDPAEEGRFAGLWARISRSLGRRSSDKLAFELLNEPVAHEPASWNRVALAAFRAIRRLEPERTIVLGSNRFNQVSTFDKLEVPDDPRQILTFHYYNPMPITHYKAKWTAMGVYDGPVSYPGLPIEPTDLARVNEPERSKIVSWNVPYDRAAMARDLAKPLAVRQRTGRPLYCGEFGVLNTVPRDMRLAWYRDFISVLNEYGIAWGNWDYRGGFGIIDREGKSTGVAEVLLGRESA